MQKFPKSIRIGYQTYALKEVTAFSTSDQAGQFNSADATIEWKNRGNATDIANTLIHESLHACFYTHGLCEGLNHTEEERIVNTLANALTGWMKDNPQLINCIMERLK